MKDKSWQLPPERYAEPRIEPPGGGSTAIVIDMRDGQVVGMYDFWVGHDLVRDDTNLILVRLDDVGHAFIKGENE